jgi:hypothetical protein
MGDKQGVWTIIIAYAICPIPKIIKRGAGFFLPGF